MSKLTVLQNTFRRNPYLRETVCLNLIALKQAKIDFQYIVFNDNGDEEIWNDIKEFENDIEYFYSPINYGRRMGRGGWIGGLHLVKNEYLHVSDQDDVMSPLFYKRVVNYLDNNRDVYVVFTNGFLCNEKLQSTNSLIPVNFYGDYKQPLEAFKDWFGIFPPLNKVTKANNGVLGPGAVYRTELHELVGTPDANFGGAYDFEYWSRILFNGYKMEYIPQLLWFYRQSGFSAGNEIIDGKPNRGYWQQLYIEQIKEKYSKLWEERVNAETNCDT
jgi:cellulose synthase/poly-beta-1,6-N-acetylglucosamine synthase-like glycosyltransferase